MIRLSILLVSYVAVASHGLVLIAAAPSTAGVSSGATSPASQVADAQLPFRPITDQQLALARTAANHAAQRLDQFLARGSVDNRMAWHAFLGWETLQSQLQLPSSDPNVLGEVLGKMYSGEVGLELPAFVQLRDAVMSLRRLQLAQSDPEIERLYQEQRDAARALMLSPAPLDDVQRVELMSKLEWLDQLQQAPELVTAARQHFSRPNLVVSATARVVARGFSEPFAETTTLNEMILKTHVRGTAHTTGTVTANLVPCNHAAVIDVSLLGTASANTIGYQHPVTIRSHATTQIHGLKRLTVADLAVHAAPAVATCSTNSQIHGISAGGRLGSKLIEKIAWKQAYKQLPQAERASSQRAEQRIAERMDDQVSQRLAEANSRLRTEVREPLLRRSIYPRELRSWTTADHLYLTAVQAKHVQLSANDVPIAVPGAELTVHVHESMLANTALTAIGGMTITDERAEELAEEFTGSVPEELRIKQDEDPWSITFDLQRPVSIQFVDQSIRIAIRGRRFVRGDQVVRQTTEISATYSVTIENGRAKLIRQGEIEVRYPDKDGERLSLTELRNKTFLINKFEGLFKPEMGGDELKMPARWEKLKDLALAHASANAGWLTLAWK